MKKLLLIVIFTLNLFAAQVNTGITKINFITAYPTYGGGDILFRVANPNSECPGGFFLKKEDPGFEATLSMVISAYHAKNDLVVYGITDQIWSGSSTKTCKAYAVMFR